MARSRSSSFSSTPTFSADLLKLRTASPTGLASSYSDAIAIASTFDVLGGHSPLVRKVTLDSEADWIAFFDKSGCVETTATTIEIHLEKFLRHCFDIAYRMPPSPKTHVRSVSHGVPVGSPGGSSGRGNPPQLRI